VVAKGTYQLDCSEITFEEDFWELYLEVTRPDGAEHFGRNLDAFWDAVSGGGPGWPGECELLLTNTGNMLKLDRRFFNGLQRIAKRVQDYPFVTIVFV
jgi:RNAse (barnase) inhibitor barstar